MRPELRSTARSSVSFTGPPDQALLMTKHAAPRARSGSILEPIRVPQRRTAACATQLVVHSVR